MDPVINLIMAIVKSIFMIHDLTYKIMSILRVLWTVKNIPFVILFIYQIN
jgi:hypothetical protein